jgi:aminopeptidase N
MTETAQFDGGLLACGGFTGVAALAERRPFALPGDRPAWGRDRPLRLDHLRLEFAFDIPRRELRGVATTTFRPRVDGLREAVFDATELEIESVTDAAGRPLLYTPGDGRLRVDFGAPQPADRALTTVVRYRCRPRRGLYFNQPDAGYPARPAQIWTQGQAEDSAHYFPCVDYPGEKCTTELIATVPAGWFALSNGRLESQRSTRGGTTFHWVQDVPHPAYLVSLVAGELDEVTARAGDVPVQYYGPRGSAADLRRAFGRTPEMVEFFAAKIGVPYPYAKYATVAVADFIFGGMENTSATTMTDTLLHDERAHEDMVDVADSITAHELAHQWFGDLLTCREWSHGWLHESFATYFDALYTEHSRGWDAFRYKLGQNAQLYMQEDANSYRRPLVQHVYTEPIDIFDRHLYERGSLVLDMLRTELGDEQWWRAIGHYVRKHAQSDVLTFDLQRAIEEATGRNLDWFFDQWVWKGGHPELKAAYRWDAQRNVATVTIEQTQQPDATLTSVYRAPFGIAFHVGADRHEFNVELTEARHSFAFALPAAPRFVAIDPGARLLKTLTFDPGEAMLRAQLTDDPQAMGRIEAARGLAKLASATAVEALRDALLQTEQSELVRAEIATALGDARSAAARDALIAALAAEPSRVRRAAAAALGKFPVDDAAARGLARLLAGRGDRSYYVQAAAADALGRTRDASALPALRRVLGRPAHNDVITAGALSGLAQTRDPRALDALLDYTAWGRHQNARRAAVDALGVLAPLADEAGRLRARERLEQLLDDPWLRVQLSAVGALAALKDVRAVPALGRCADRALDGRLRRSARVAARALTEGADRSAELRALREQVERLQQEQHALRDRLVQLEGPAAAEPAAAPRRAAATRRPAPRAGRGRRS